MDTSIKYKIVGIGIIAVLLMAQAAPKGKQQLMDEAIQEKMDSYTKTLLKRCEKDVQERALEIVDSLLLLEAQFKTVDTFERPPKPNKPSRPAVKLAKDTSDVEPLFDDN